MHQTDDQAKIIRTIAGIVRASRKQLGLSQVTLSQKMGISQGALSKIESGILTLNAPQWFLFCQITGVEPDSAITGYVDFKERAELRNGTKEHGFKLPSPYSQLKTSKVRTLLPLMGYFRSIFPDQGWEEYLKSRNLDPDFFLNLDNQISVRFFLDTTEYLRSSGHLKPDDLPRLTAPISQPGAHGQLRNSYARTLTTSALLSQLVANAPYYECNYRYEVEDLSSEVMVIGATPNPHMESFKNHPGFSPLLCEYRKNYFQRFATYGGNPAPRTEEKQCIHKGANRCVLEVNLS